MYNEFKEIASYYDELYVQPEHYQAEARQVHELIRQYRQSAGTELLDIACGTGGHIPGFQENYQVTGLDLSEDMLAIASRKFPLVRFHLGNMVDFSLDSKFDAIVNLYGSIGFVKTQENLDRAVANFARHMVPGGVLILTPWSTQEDFHEGMFTDAVNRQDVAIARLEAIQRKGTDRVEVTMHHLVGRGGNVEYHTQAIEIGLFSRAEYTNSIRQAGLELLDFYNGPHVAMGAYIARLPRA